MPTAKLWIQRGFNRLYSSFPLPIEISADWTDRTAGSGWPTCGVPPLDNLDLLVQELLLTFPIPGKLEGIRQVRFAFGHARDHVRTTQPVRFLQISERPARRMVRMRMVEADDILTSIAALTLNAHQLLGIDMVTIVRRINPSIPAPGRRGNHALVPIRGAQENPATLVGIGFLAVLPDGLIFLLRDLQHGRRF